MLTAVEQYYGLKAHPFSLTPDLRFAYHSRSHSRALAQVTAALARREGLLVITGEIGAGKTMLCRTLRSVSDPRTFLSIVTDPRVTADQLLWQMLHDFGASRKPAAGAPVAAAVPNRHQLVTTLQQFLASLIPLNAHAVVMIDEAQQLAPTVLEEIRLLSNFETDEAKLLQIVLLGQPDLDDLLRRPDMRQLSQRVARRFELQPLSAAEVHDYIQHRLLVATDPEAGPADGSAAASAAPAAAVQFTPAAIQLITRISRGIPRVINTVCDRTLETGFERQARVIDDTIVATAAQGLRIGPHSGLAASRASDVRGEGAADTSADLTVAPPSADRRRRNLAIAAVLLALATLGAWRWVPRQSAGAPPLPRAVAPETAIQSGAQPDGRPAERSAERAVSEPAPQSPSAPGAPPSTSPSALAARGAGATVPPVTPAPASAAAAGLPATASRLGTPSAPTPASAERYQIQVASFRTVQRASQVAGGLETLGLVVEIRHNAAGGWYHLVVGPFTTVDEASAAQRTLVREGFAATFVTPIAGK